MAMSWPISLLSMRPPGFKSHETQTVYCLLFYNTNALSQGIDDSGVLSMEAKRHLLEPPKEWKGPRVKFYWLLGPPIGHLRPGGES